MFSTSWIILWLNLKIVGGSFCDAEILELIGKFNLVKKQIYRIKEKKVDASCFSRIREPGVGMKISFSPLNSILIP
jgi:hypothetical protein